MITSSSPGDPVSGPPEALDVGALLEAARGGDRRALARLLSAAERGGPDGRAAAAAAYRHPTEADTVGITGAPGAGKFTLTDRLISAARGAGVSRLAVLAIDPTSPSSG